MLEFLHSILPVLQAAEYVERILKPREEEKRRKKEMLFNRLFPDTSREGHILGVKNYQYFLKMYFVL